MKEKAKGFIAGMLTTATISGIVLGVAAEDIYKTAQIAYDNIKICIDGTIIEPKDANGNTVEPFTLNGTTYLPVRAVAGAFNKEVDWDDATSTVYIGKKPDSGVAAADGSRSNPYGPAAGVTIPFNEYSFEPTSQVQVNALRLLREKQQIFLLPKKIPIMSLVQAIRNGFSLKWSLRMCRLLRERTRFSRQATLYIMKELKYLTERIFYNKISV